MGLKVQISLIVFTLVIVTFPASAVQAFSSSADATVIVHPDRLTVTVNETFQIFINVSAASKLQGFDFMLAYNSTLLNCSDLEEGAFLSGFGSTMVAKHEINNSIADGRGRAWFAVVIYGTGSGDGKGTLAVLSFKALSVGQTVLDLFSDYPLREDEVKLTTCLGQVIPNKAVDGLVVVVAGSGDPADPPPSASQNPQNRLADADMDGDGAVDIKDVAIVAVAYGTVEGDLKFNFRADLDQNGKVDILDVAFVASYYMRKT